MKSLCSICNKMFEHKNKYTKTCSLECRKVLCKRYKAKWYKDNYIPVYYTLLCPICKKDFQSKTKRAMFCSDKCKQVAANKRRKNRYNLDEKYRQKVLLGCKKYSSQLSVKKHHREYNKKYREENKVYLQILHGIYYLNNRKQLKEKIKNRSKTLSAKAIRKIYCKEYYKIFKNRILSACRRRIYKTLKGKSKSLHSLELLGCTAEELKQHLEKQFTEGMTWNNYGSGIDRWSMDHIVPCSLFDLSKASEQKKCFNYKNLQPLWSIDNSKKGNKIDWNN